MLLWLLACAGPNENELNALQIERATLTFASARLAIEASLQVFLWPWLEIEDSDGELHEYPMKLEGLGIGMALEAVATSATAELDLSRLDNPTGDDITGRYWGGHVGATAGSYGVERAWYIKANGIRMSFQADSWGLGAGAGGERLRLRVDESVGWLDEDPFFTADTGEPGDTGDTGGASEVN
ncbi:MAG: hypothetical protein VX899_27615 [Myxococcota bacterium]|nr:hypothetical protein [Myxococcota bacterium]